ncbi:hypothetical protein [Streptomyces sp. PBH53]|uniref:hypothetical protein n=1 Tax=Streptomyces sp. PBH53 TaxID=1577075 RepID=UPI000B01C263|nr:hypothetical protein [Streptomyces sp. PBH53]
MAQRSFRKIPDSVRSKVANLPSNEYQVGVLRSYSVSDLKSDLLAHLEVSVQAGSIVIPPTSLPPAERGRFSKWNLVGRIVRRTDLPKVSRSWGFETPNFGDWSKGSHTITFTRQVYQVEHLYGHQIAIAMEEVSSNDDQVTIAFRVESVLDRTAAGHDADLLFALCLLQENVGAVDVVARTTSTDEWARAMALNWEFLPVGTREADAVISDLTRRLRLNKDDPRRGGVEARLEALLALRPERMLYGTSGFQRYIGAQFGPGLVVFENARYGNAIYVMFEDWEELSKRSRLDLLGGSNRSFERITHRRGWEGRLRHAVQTRRNDST